MWSSSFCGGTVCREWLLCTEVDGYENPIFLETSVACTNFNIFVAAYLGWNKYSDFEKVSMSW